MDKNQLRETLKNWSKIHKAAIDIFNERWERESKHNKNLSTIPPRIVGVSVYDLDYDIDVSYESKDHQYFEIIEIKELLQHLD